MTDASVRKPDDENEIMGLIAKLTQQVPGKLTMNREQLIGPIESNATFQSFDDESLRHSYFGGEHPCRPPETPHA